MSRGPGNVDGSPGNVARYPGNKSQIQEMTSEYTNLAKNIRFSLKMSPGNHLLFQGNGHIGPGNVLGGPGNDVTECRQVLYYSGVCTSRALNIKRG